MNCKLLWNVHTQRKHRDISLSKLATADNYMVIAHAALTTASCNAITRAMKGQWLAIPIQNLYVRLTYSYVNVRKMSWKKKKSSLLLLVGWFTKEKFLNFTKPTSFLLRSSCVKDTPAGRVN